MTYTTLRRATAVCLLTCVAVFSLLAQNYKDLVGKWDMTSETEGDPVSWTLILKDTDGKLNAALATQEGEQEAKEFSYQDGVLKFKAPYQDQDYDIELKVTAGKLDGKWIGGGASGRTSGARHQTP